MDVTRVREIMGQLRELGVPEATLRPIEDECVLTERRIDVPFDVILRFDPAPIECPWGDRQHPTHRDADDLERWLRSVLCNAKPLGVTVNIFRAESSDVR